MTDRMIGRRRFLTNSIAAAAGVSGAVAVSGTSESRAAAPADQQEFYELRVYQIENTEKQKVVSDFLKDALVPALNRMGVDRVGVFSEEGKPDSFSLFCIIPYKSLDAFAGVNPALASDDAYRKAAAAYFASPMKNPPYKRVNSRLMKAFSGMPVLELPAESKAGKPRVFELRTYESHNEDAAARKVDMFNKGEIDIMRDVKLGPVFFGEMLVGDDVPNLMYMLSAPDLDAHKQHWRAFSAHPEWKRMKAIDKYKGTVSKITNWFLSPTSFSQM